jgi:hypothetical protein
MILNAMVDKNVRVVIQEKEQQGEIEKDKSDVTKIQQRATIKNKSGHSC